MKVQLKRSGDLWVEKKFSEVQSIDWKSALDQLHKVYDTYIEVVRESGITKMKCTVEKKYEDQVLNYARQIVHEPDYLIGNLLDNFFRSTIKLCEFINQPDLHIFGDAGTGKTHIACNICEDRLKDRLPALFVRGSLFMNNQTLEKQLQDILDISPYFNWDDFLQALSAAAEAYHTRIPLVIDGLNESTHNGAFSKIWELGLKGLVQEITQTKNVVLITTCRTTYKDAIWEDGYPPNSVHAYGFDTDEVRQEAIDKYFNAYKIVADPTLAPFMQFEHPIYLKIFCETKRRTSDKEEPVYVGEETLFGIFEEYLNVCNKEVCKHLKLHRGTSIVRTELNKIAEYLWKNHCRHIPFDVLTRLVDGQSRGELDWESSKTHVLVAEGLLLYQDRGQFGDVINFTYDLLGGYLIAQYLIQQSDDDMKGFINSEETVATLFSENYQTLHPLSRDIVRSLAALLPVKIGKYLHDLSENKIARYYSNRALFEISPRYITTDCRTRIAHIFSEKPESRKPLFKLAESTVGHLDHPFNASFWSKQLSALSMPERDLSWAEHVRKNCERFEKVVMRFEETCQNSQELSEVSEKRLHLYAEHIMWILTSTVRPLRDKTTRALYWYGRRFPQEFFDLVIKSFIINDPYVPERMLAATYGVAMARQNDFDDTSFVDEMLPKYAKQLYESMFKTDAPYSTTHILARDYARRTIDIALIHDPKLLSDDQRERINPPYTDGGIRGWGENEHRGEGPPPIQMDFDIYTLDRLIKYDSQDPDERKRLKANVYWRIYDLGFTNESFGKIDKEIAEINFRFSIHDDARKTDRYGKKYSWIAFYELAGFRQDNDLLPDHYEGGRISDADIDPSFPVEHREYNLVQKDFLGDRHASPVDWVTNTLPPDLTQYLEVDQLCEDQESWVLLHGYLRQKDKQVNRNMFAWLHGLIVKSEEVEEIVEILNKQEDIDAHIIPSDHRTYAGEIPWCSTYPLNIWQELSVKTGVDLVEKRKLVLERKGEPLSEQEQDEFWDSVKDLTEGEWEKIKARLSEQNIECKMEIDEIEKPQYQEIEVLVPVRENNWEESCSAANPYRSIALPAREIAENLGLCGQSNSFDLFEKENGRRASISFRYGEIYGNVQHFTYLRKDLLERYLAEIGGELIWIIWGNRRLVSQNPGDPYENFQEVKTYSDIQKPFGDS